MYGNKGSHTCSVAKHLAKEHFIGQNNNKVLTKIFLYNTTADVVK